MADQVMTVVPVTKAGILSIADHASVLHGNAAGGDYFYFPNDGKTILWVDGVTGDTFNFTATSCSHGRTEALGPVVAVGKEALIGPFPPDLWNDSSGRVKFKPAVGNPGDHLLAVRVG